MNEAQIWEELIARVASDEDRDVTLAWLESQGIGELDARRMLQFQVEREAS